MPEAARFIPRTAPLSLHLLTNPDGLVLHRAWLQQGSGAGAVPRSSACVMAPLQLAGTWITQ